MDYRSLWDTIIRRRIAIVIVATIGLLLLPSALRVVKPTYSGTARILLVSEQTQRDPLVKPKDLTTFATSSLVLQHVKDQLGLTDDIAYLKSQIRVQVVVESNVIPITFRSHSAALAVAVPNAVANEVVNAYRGLSTRQYGSLTQQLRSQLADQRAKIRKIDYQYQTAVAGGSFTGNDQSLDALTAHLHDLDSQRDQAYATLVSDTAQANGRAQQLDATSIIRQQVLEANPEYRNIRDAAAMDAAKLSLEKSRYTESYPGLRGLLDQVARENNALRSAKQRLLVSEVTDDRAQLGVLDQQIAAEHARLVDLSQPGGVTPDVLRAERDAAEATYQTLSTSLGQALANEAEAASLGSVVVIDRAVPATTWFEGATERAALGLVIVLGFAISYAFILDAVDLRLNTSEQVEKLYGRPVLASLRVQ
jgi:capsular polysaccharide biosynthesis protein